MGDKLRMAKASMRPARVPEKAEQAHIVQLLRSIGGRVYVMGTHRRRGDFYGTMQTEGIPDLMAFLPARRFTDERPAFLFIECKASGGHLRPEQRVFQEQCDAAKIRHLVGGLDAVIAWLIQTGYVTAEQFPTYRQPRSEP